MNLTRAIDGFLLDFLAGGGSENTARLYKINLTILVGFLGDVELGEVKPDDLKNYMLWLRTEYKPKRPNGNKDPLSDAAIDNHWKALRSFFRWAGEALGNARPDTGLKQPRYRLPVVTPFKREEVEALVKACEYSAEYHNPQAKQGYCTRRPTAARDKALVLLLLDTGLRVSEVCRLRVCHVNESGEVEVLPHGNGQKTKPRFVYLGRAARRAVWLLLSKREGANQGDALFLTDDDRPMRENTIRKLLRNLGQRAGVKNVHPHRFRHSFAIEYLRNSGDVFTLRAILGHSTLAMVQNYLELVRSDIAEAHGRASPGDNWRL